jgi:hypothetical protein
MMQEEVLQYGCTSGASTIKPPANITELWGTAMPIHGRTVRNFFAYHKASNQLHQPHVRKWVFYIRHSEQ